MYYVGISYGLVTVCPIFHFEEHGKMGGHVVNVEVKSRWEAAKSTNHLDIHGFDYSILV